MIRSMLSRFRGSKPRETTRDAPQQRTEHVKPVAYASPRIVKSWTLKARTVGGSPPNVG